MKRQLIFASLLLSTYGHGQGFDPANYKSLEWANVGPNRGGRSIACTGVRTKPNEYYFGATGGGLWKTTDAGNSWACVTDGFLGSSSVGAVAVSDSNPNVVYIGTGEREIRGDISEGDGVYRSTDGGKTWTSLGLKDTRTISKIVVDPKDPNLVYVAALGHIYGPNAERGIFKSTDGGTTWNKVLFESKVAGAVDLILDPQDPKVLYAATWEAWRTPYKLSSGGPGSKFWKSFDSGSTWTDITRSAGLPKGTIGKIGIAVSPVNHQRVYAIVEAVDGGIFRSEDGGATWVKLTDDAEYRQRAWYFSHVFADPKELNKVYCLNVGAFKSADGGKSWSSFGSTHSDNHDLWINPDDPSKLIEANDGGASVSINGGQNWSKENFPTAEIYHVSADSHIPYRIYGAQQDNSAVRLMPDQSDRPDHRNFDNTAGGESGYITPNTGDPDIVYGGNYSGDITQLNYRTMMRRQLDVWPENPMGHPAADLKHRVQWTFPIVTSPHDSKVIYTTSQYVLRTTNDGQSWDQISPDLTRNDKSKQGSSGGPLTQDNTSVEYYDTVFTVAESPVRRGVIWAGSDDGLVHVTQNGGRNWDDVTPLEMPHWGRVSMVEPSPHDSNTAYIAVNDYQNGDLKPYIYRTHDMGRTWKLIVSGISPTAFARVCREDLHRSGLLYAGTETGAYVSFDDGERWQSLQQNLPLCPVHDLLLKDDDLIAATHGRSFWIMHNISRLSELTAEKPSRPVFFHPIDRIKTGSSRIIFDYYLPAKAKSVTFEVRDRKRNLVGKSLGEADPGIHTDSISLFHPAFKTFPGMVLWSGYAQAISLPPGEYTVLMDVDGFRTTTTARLLVDPRGQASIGDLEQQYSLACKISDRTTEANQAVLRIRDIKGQIEAARKDVKASPAIIASGALLVQRLTSIEGEIYQYRSKSGEDPLNFPIKLNDKLAGVLGFVTSGSRRPPRQAYQVFDGLSKQLQVQLDGLKLAESTELAALNSQLKLAQIKVVEPKNPELITASRQRGGKEEEGSE